MLFLFVPCKADVSRSEEKKRLSRCSPLVLIHVAFAFSNTVAKTVFALARKREYEAPWRLRFQRVEDTYNLKEMYRRKYLCVIRPAHLQQGLLIPETDDYLALDISAGSVENQRVR